MRLRLDHLPETGVAGGRNAYVAVSLVLSIDPDPADRTLIYARISDFIEFDRRCLTAIRTAVFLSICPYADVLSSARS